MLHRGVALRIHQRHRALYKVENSIFIDLEENIETIELCRLILSGIIYHRASDSTQSISSTAKYNENQDYGEEKTARNIAMRLKDN